jgi:UDP-2-acetamido-3-amino-2,3-dideoxy-glucuronate N-acetyltransferase
MAGVPAKQIGWMNQFGERLNLPLAGNAETICEKTKIKYSLIDGKVNIKET